MKTIKTGMVLKDFRGKELKIGEDNATIGEVIAGVLSGQQTQNPVIAWQLGKKFACDKTVDLSAEDIVFLKKELEASKTFSAVAIGQLIEILDSKE